MKAVILKTISLCCSVARSCPTLCNPMDCGMPGLPVLQYLPEFAQTHVRCVSDGIQPSHLLLPPSPLALSLSQSFPRSFPVSQLLHWVAKVLELQVQQQSFQWIFRTNFLGDWLVWSPCCPRDLQESSPTTQFKNINSSAPSFLYSPTLTSIDNYWKNHSF